MMMKDKITKADAADPTFMNHVIWYSATDWKRLYPGRHRAWRFEVRVFPPLRKEPLHLFQFALRSRCTAALVASHDAPGLLRGAPSEL
jgi:hypothetical protein